MNTTDINYALHLIEPPGLYRGPVALADGRMLEGMLGQERFVTQNGVDISDCGSWTEYSYRSSGVRVDKDPSDLAFELSDSTKLINTLQQAV